MLGHIGIYVNNLKESDDFYRPLLKVIGLEVFFDFPECVAYGTHGHPYFEIYTGKPASSPIHIAFRVESQKQVKEFHATALRLGAKDNGEPGVRKWEGLQYYAAFIIDLNGHNLEALF